VRTRTTTTITGIAAALLALAACSSGSKTDDTAATTKPAATATTAAAKKVDCSDPNLSQADWTENCDKGGGDTQKQFGQVYRWSDGVTVTVTEAKVFTNFNKEFDEHPTAGSTDFRVKIRITNGSHQPFDLGKLSTITEGATSGGEASVGLWTDNGSPLEGRLAPGVTVTKTDDGTLETRYGKKIVVTVQRSTDDLSAAFPEFSGTITG
jgi:hypothetical protein